MSVKHATSERSTPVTRALASRGAELGVPVWHLTATGDVHQAPPAGLAVGQWARAAGYDRHVSAALRAAARPMTSPLEIQPGCWCLLIPITQGTRASGFAVGLVWYREWLQTREFRDACALAGTSREMATSVLEPVLRTRRADVHDLYRMLLWTAADLTQVHRDTAAIEQFGDRLSAAYEEANLLFRFARLVQCIDTPGEVVRAVCSQIQEVLPFNWVAARFRDSACGIPEITGRFFVGGELPVEPSGVEQMVVALDAQNDADDWTRILDPVDSDLARAVGAVIVVEPISHRNHRVGVLIAGNKSGPDNDVTSGEARFLEAAADFLGVFHENLTRFSEQKSLFVGTLRAVTASIDAKDPYTRGHSERVALLAAGMAEAMGMDATLVERYRIAGLVHDVGKIGVPEAVLCKQGRLEPAEFDKIKMHPEIGYRILRDIPGLEDVLPGVLHHHERFGGGGYPRGLAGEQIPLMARVLALADTFDAMSSTRSYRPALPRERVIAELRTHTGTQFDPSLVPTFLALDFRHFDRMASTTQDRPTTRG